MGTEGRQHIRFPALSVEGGECQAKAAAAKKAEEEALPLVEIFGRNLSPGLWHSNGPEPRRANMKKNRTNLG